MNIQENNIYHIYNQGNNKQPIFYTYNHYVYFLKKYRQHIHPICDTLAYCLMPNHFHFLIYANPLSVGEKKVGGIVMTTLAHGFQTLLSGYTTAINKQQNTSGSLFRQRTKAKLIEPEVAIMVGWHFIIYTTIH